MLFSTIGQLPVFLWMTGAGLIVGALYSLAAALRRLLDAGFWLTLTIDALFGLCAAGISIAALVTGSYGRLRLYELLGAALGFCLYLLGPRPLLSRLSSALGQEIRSRIAKTKNFRIIKFIFR